MYALLRVAIIFRRYYLCLIWLVGGLGADWPPSKCRLPVASGATFSAESIPNGDGVCVGVGNRGKVGNSHYFETFGTLFKLSANSGFALDLASTSLSRFWVSPKSFAGTA